MTDEAKSGSTPEGPPGLPNKLLPQALEDLLARRAAGAGAACADAVRCADDECPEPGEWMLLLAGEPRSADFVKISRLLTHAGVCRACAERLRTLAGDATAEEAAALRGLACSTTEGQRNLAQELARTPRNGASKPMRSYLWLGAGLAASLVIAVGAAGWWRAANNPERLLAEAYTQERIFELRMPGAGFAPVQPLRHVRGHAGQQRPQKLGEAGQRIAQRLAAAPEGPQWLQLEARYDLLQEKYDAAIDILDRLVAAGQPTASLLLDDASAHFERGVATETESDRATALNELRAADKLAPGDTVVLFNEAIAMEDSGELVNGIETWNRFLHIERDPRWQAEGRARLQALEQKLNALKAHRG